MSLLKPCNGIKGGFQMPHVTLLEALKVWSQSIQGQIRKHYQHPPIQICPLYRVFLDSSHNNIFQVSPSSSATFATVSSEFKRIRPSGATSLKKPRADVPNSFGLLLIWPWVKMKPRSRARRQSSFYPFANYPAFLTHSHLLAKLTKD